MEELPAGGVGLELGKFATDLMPPLFDEDSPENEGSSSSTAVPNKFQSSIVQAAGELEEKQLPLTSASFQDSNSSSISDSEAYIELNDLLEPNPPSSTSYNDGFIYEDSDDYFDPEELLEQLIIESDQT